MVEISVASGVHDVDTRAEHGVTMPPDTDRSSVCGAIDAPRKTAHYTPTHVGGDGAVSGCEVCAVRRARPGTHDPDGRARREPA